MSGIRHPTSSTSPTPISHHPSPRPAQICAQLLRAMDAAEGRRTRRKRNTTPDALGMEVTAEGVETAGALALLRVMGCDHIQGYLVAKPLELSALDDLLGDTDFGASFARASSPFKLPVKSSTGGRAS